ncbi:MAG: hypothetical protein GC191_08985 [Azospirillum sp.]|nr:hypothetical protein [Azospirillum sp.]
MNEIHDLFRCEAYSMRLSKKSCAGFFNSMKDKTPQPWDSKRQCRGCSIGAVHAGGGETPAEDRQAKAEAAFRALHDEWSRVCSRCMRLASRVVGGRLCVSCYNRSREVRVGENRRGSAPRLKLRTEAVVVASAGSPVWVERVKDVSGRLEAIVAVAQRADGPVAFGRRLNVPLPGQQVGAWRGGTATASRQMEFRL